MGGLAVSAAVFLLAWLAEGRWQHVVARRLEGSEASNEEIIREDARV